MHRALKILIQHGSGSRSDLRVIIDYSKVSIRTRTRVFLILPGASWSPNGLHESTLADGDSGSSLRGVWTVRSVGTSGDSACLVSQSSFPRNWPGKRQTRHAAPSLRKIVTPFSCEFCTFDFSATQAYLTSLTPVISASNHFIRGSPLVACAIFAKTP